MVFNMIDKDALFCGTRAFNMASGREAIRD